jgi:WD40 repeat protein
LVSGSDDGTISLLHVASGRLLSQIQCQQFGQVRTRGKLYQTISNHESNSLLPQVKRIAFSPDGSILASAHSANIVALWNRCDARGRTLFLTRALLMFCRSKTWELIEGLEGHTDQVFDVSWLDESTLVSASHDGTVRM